MKRQQMIVGAGLLAGALLVLGAPVSQAVTLSDGDWTVEIDPSSAAGINAWVDPLGVNHLNQEWYWLSDGGERVPVDVLSTLDTVVSDTNGDGDDDRLFTRYTDVDIPLEVEISYQLNDAGILLLDTGPEVPLFASSLVKTITLTNLSDVEPLEGIDFWIYTDMELGGDPQDDFLGNLSDEFGTSLIQVEDDVDLSLYEFDIVPLLLLGYFLEGDRFLSDEEGELLAFLENDTDELPLPTDEVFDGDLSFLYQLQIDLGPGGSVQFQTPQNLYAPVPEPHTAALLAAGLAGLGWASRRGSGRR